MHSPHRVTPFALTKGPGRRRAGFWSKTPLAGLALSLAAAAFSTFVLKADPGGLPGRLHGASVVHVAIVVAVYYCLSIALAFALGDQRAFCKYLCPSGQILRWISRLALAAIRAGASAAATAFSASAASWPAPAARCGWNGADGSRTQPGRPPE